MRTMWRNKRPLWFVLYEGKEALTDSEGFETGEYRLKYGKPHCMEANISAASGSAQIEQFGNLTGYDKVMVTDDVCCPIDENTVLFVDKCPEFDGDGRPIYDYVIRRVARSLNSVSYAIQKVEIS